MADPLDNAAVTPLVLRFKASENETERERLFRQITEMCLPLVTSTILRHHWDLTLGESLNDLVHNLVVKMPKILAGWKPHNGSSFGSYFIAAVVNTFRKEYAKRVRRWRYRGEMPEEEISDSNTERLNGNVTTMQQRGHEFERLCLLIPGELAELVDAEYSGLVHYIASRYLQRADNGQTLFLSDLRKEVLLLPSAVSLSEREIDALVRMVVAGTRARLYSLRPVEENGEASGLGFLYSPDEGATPIGFLSHSSYKLWPLLLIFDPPTTRFVLHCLAGLVESVPTKDKWSRERTSEAAYANAVIP